MMTLWQKLKQWWRAEWRATGRKHWKVVRETPFYTEWDWMVESMDIHSGRTRWYREIRIGRRGYQPLPSARYQFHAPK